MAGVLGNTDKGKALKERKNVFLYVHPLQKNEKSLLTILHVTTVLLLADVH